MAFETLLGLLFFLPIILLFFIPHIAFIIFTIISYKKWKTQKTSVWTAAMISSILATLALIGISVLPIYYTFTGLDDPLFFVPLLAILFLGLPIALSILIIGWSIIILFFTIKIKIKNTKTNLKKWQSIVAIIILILAIISLALFLFRSSVLQKAESLETSPEVLTELSNHAQLDVRRAVAKNPSTPRDVLYKLYEEKNENGYRLHIDELADNPKSPQDILRKIYDDPRSHKSPLDYRLYKIAQNPNTPEDIIRELSSKPDQSIIIGLARNQNLPEDLVIKLKNHHSEQVRTAVNEVHGE